jgi:hypothetical protein
MKKVTMILALTIVTGFLFTSAVKAIHPMLFTGMAMNTNASEQYEKAITLNGWMISVGSFTGTAQNTVEKEPGIRSWMLDPSWISEQDRLASEPELRLEDWMLIVWDMKDKTSIMKDAMCDTKG